MIYCAVIVSKFRLKFEDRWFLSVNFFIESINKNFAEDLVQRWHKWNWVIVFQIMASLFLYISTIILFYIL